MGPNLKMSKRAAPRARKVWSALCVLLAACAPLTLNNDAPNTNPGTDEDDAGLSTDCSTIPAPRELAINATSAEQWVYLDLARGRTVNVTGDPAASRAWDLAFRRFAIKQNGGVSGSGGVETAVAQGTFDSVTEPPSEGFASDAPDGADDDLEPDYLLSTGDTGWYDYDTTTHTLSPRAQVYVVRSVDGYPFKLVVLNYYSAAGTSGHPKIRFQPLVPLCAEPLPEPDAGLQEDAGPDAAIDTTDAGSADGVLRLTVDAASTATWTYVSVSEGVVDVSEPGQSHAWDLAFQRTLLRTNGGTSGSGQGGALALQETFGDVHEVPADADTQVQSDALVPIPGPPGSGEASGNPALNEWYDYDVTTHVVTPKSVTYLLRRASGEYAKLRIKSYSSGVFEIELAALPTEPAP